MDLSLQQIQAQISKYKVKEGFLHKRYGFFNNEWKERWIVLTQNYLISFQFKHKYTKEYQILPIEDVETLKSYFKKQQQRDLSFRVQNKKQNFYLAAKTNQDKWAWIGAIQRVIDKKQTKVFNPKAKSYDPLLLKLQSNACLQQQYQKTIKIVNKQNTQINRKKQKTMSQKDKVQSKQSQISLIIQNKQSNTPGQMNPDKINTEIGQTKTQQLQNNHQKTQISKKQEVQSKVINSKDQIIWRLFDDILNHQRDMKFFVDFIANLTLDQSLDYTDSVVDTCINHPKARYFIESVVKVFSQEMDQHPMNIQLLFLILLHQYYGNYFYTTDLKVLVENLIRGLELYKSELNHNYILQLIEALITTDDWNKISQERKNQLKELIYQISKISPSQTNQNLSKTILECI